jgi:hypothetical protein
MCISSRARTGAGNWPAALRRSWAARYGPELPGIDQPMLIVSFPGGGHLSIEFTDDAPDEEQPRLGTWLELRADDPAAVHQAALGAGLTEVRHPGHSYYFMIPGGQVFTIAPTS